MCKKQWRACTNLYQVYLHYIHASSPCLSLCTHTTPPTLPLHNSPLPHTHPQIVRKGILEAQLAARPDAPDSKTKQRRKTILEDLLAEISVMRTLKHRNIVTLREVVDDPESNKLLLVMDYMEGGPVMTREALDKGHRIPEAVARHYFRDMLKALDYLHMNKIVHGGCVSGVGECVVVGGVGECVVVDDLCSPPLKNTPMSYYPTQKHTNVLFPHSKTHPHKTTGDLKPENVLMSSKGNVALSDFGCSKLISGGDDTLDRCNGTPAFLAPEMMRPKSKYRYVLSTDVLSTEVHVEYRSTCTVAYMPYSVLSIDMCPPTHRHTPHTYPHTHRGRPADIYALGACLYTFIFGRIPFNAPSVVKLFQVVQTQPLTFPENMPVCLLVMMMMMMMLVMVMMMMMMMLLVVMMMMLLLVMMMMFLGCVWCC